MLALLQDVADEVINPRFRALADGEIHEKNPGDLVTDADREAEVLITAALVAAYPDCVVLGEEAHSLDPSLMERYAAADHAFTVDPVDGTKNFVHGSKDHAVMASETRDGEVVRAWIWQPQHDLGYVAERGGGTWRHSAAGVERLEVTPPSDTADLRGRTSRRAWIGRSLGGSRADDPDLGVVRHRLPQARRGRGRLRALPLCCAVGPRAGRAAARRGGRHRGQRPTAAPTPRATLAPPGLVAAGRPHGIRAGMPCACVERPPGLSAW